MLYCDCDTLFLAPMPELADIQPEWVACSGEFSQNNQHYQAINTGAMIMNVQNLREDGFFDFIHIRCKTSLNAFL